MPDLQNGMISAVGPNPDPPAKSEVIAQTVRSAVVDHDDGLVSEATEQAAPKQAPGRKPQRDPLAAQGPPKVADEQPDPSPLFDFDDDEPGAENATAEARAAAADPGDEQVETTGEEPQAKTIDENLYLRALEAGFERDDARDMAKENPDRLERLVAAAERAELRRARLAQTTPEPAAKEPETEEEVFDREFFRDKYGMEETMIAELEANFEARKEHKKLAERLDRMEKEQQQRERQAAIAEQNRRIDKVFQSLKDSYGDLFGGDQTADEMLAEEKETGEPSRALERRRAIGGRAAARKQADIDAGKRPRSDDYYLKSAAEFLFGGEASQAAADRQTRTDTAERLRNRQGQFIKPPTARNSPPAPETGDEAALANIRSKIGARDDPDAIRAADESLL